MQYYVFRYTVDEELLREFYKGWPPIWLKALYAGVAVYLAVDGIRSLRSGSYIAAVACLFVAFLVGWGLFQFYRGARLQRKRLLEITPGHHDVEYVFGEEGVVLRNLTSGGELYVEYIRFTRLSESGMMFLLQTKAKQCVLIPKADMSAEQRGQFTQFLFTHCPKLRRGIS